MIRLLNRFMGKIHYSKFGPIIARSYEMITKERVSVVRRYNASFELSNRLPGERAILFYAYEPKVTNIFLSLLDEGDTVVDVGAWIGYYALLAASKVGYNGKVIAIEPHPLNLAKLHRNIELNGFDNIIVIESAVGAEETSMELETGSTPLLHRLKDSNYTYVSNSNDIVKESRNNTIKVNVRRLDNILAALGIDDIKLLMMDIEGYEYNALLGCGRWIEEGKIDNIIVEVHTYFLQQLYKSFDDVLNVLKHYGYHIEIIDHINDSIDRYHIIARRNGKGGWVIIL